METDDLLILDELRQLTNDENADEVIWQKNLAAERSRASAQIVGHDKLRGWQVQQIDGTKINNPAIHTTGALGRGQKVDLNRGATSAAIDTKPTGNNNLSSSTAPSTGSDTSSSGGSFGGGGGQFWRANPEDQSCKPVSYTGEKRSGDFASENECLTSLGLKNWKCINGACGVVAPGTGVFNSQEECEEKGQGPVGIRNGKCVVLPGNEWCSNDGEPRFPSIAACESSKYSCSDGKCIPDPNGKYKDKAECEAALVPAEFTGGQCDNVIYSVSWTINVVAIPFPTGYTLSGSTLVNGPVERIIQDKVPNGAGVDTTWFIKGKQTVSFPTGKYPFPAGVSQVTSGGATITSITRVDSLPDNCGDPQKLCPS